MHRNVRIVFAPLFYRLSLFVLAMMSSPAAFAEEQASLAKGRTEYILAVSWQPGFCETRPNRKECVGQTSERHDATHFSLHGLWPVKKSYCGVAADIKARDRKGDWLDLPKLAMAQETAAKLMVAMPGTQSGLDRHQWLRSGTCHGGTAQDYFSVQLRLLEEINGSAVRALFSGRIGREVTEGEVKQAFDDSFGAVARQFIYHMAGLNKAYGTKKVLENVHLSFYPDAKIGILGPNGAGKSTILKIMAGLDKEWIRRSLARRRRHRRLPGAGAGSSIRTKTVFENVMEGVAAKTAIIERYNELMMNYSDETADESAKLQDEMDGSTCGIWNSRSRWRWKRCAARPRIRK
jgi:ribonuclease T2